MTIKTIASCSFGKDSMAAIITHIKHGGKVDLALYAKIMFDDTLSAEFPEHEEWIHKVAIPKLEKDWGVSTKIVQGDSTYKDRFYRKYGKGKKIGRIYGFPLLIGPWCNSCLKVGPIEKNKKKLGEIKEIIGIAYDEPNRMRSKRGDSNTILPLVEHKITQEQSFEIARVAGLLSPAYRGGTKRLGCWFCHNQRVGELRKLRCEYPKLWNILLELDQDSPTKFTSTLTVVEYEERFAMEDRQLKLF